MTSTMAKKHSRLARCPACQASLPVSSHGHCPACGKSATGPNRSVHIEPSFRDSLTGERRREFYEGQKPLAVLMILIVFISPILGVFLEGVPGLLFGVIIPVAGYYLTPYVVLRLTR
jgi:hypothetical protein